MEIVQPGIRWSPEAADTAWVLYMYLQNTVSVKISMFK